MTYRSTGKLLRPGFSSSPALPASRKAEGASRDRKLGKAFSQNAICRALHLQPHDNCTEPPYGQCDRGSSPYTTHIGVGHEGNDKDKTIVEYALKDSNKPLGVATYRLVPTLPQELQGQLPSPEDISKILETL